MDIRWRRRLLLPPNVGSAPPRLLLVYAVLKGGEAPGRAVAKAKVVKAYDDRLVFFERAPSLGGACKETSRLEFNGGTRFEIDASQQMVTLTGGRGVGQWRSSTAPVRLWPASNGESLVPLLNALKESTHLRHVDFDEVIAQAGEALDEVDSVLSNVSTAKFLIQGLLTVGSCLPLIGPTCEAVSGGCVGGATTLLRREMGGGGGGGRRAGDFSCSVASDRTSETREREKEGRKDGHLHSLT